MYSVPLVESARSSPRSASATLSSGPELPSGRDGKYPAGQTLGDQQLEPA